MIEMIKSFILGFGHKARVISPDWLKEEVSNELLKMIELYD